MIFLPDPHAEPNPRRRKWIIAIVIGFVLAAICAKPGYHYFKQWRSTQLVTQAEQLMNDGKWTDALPKAQAAFQLDQESERTIRAMARLLTRNGRDEALRYWQSLAERGVLSGEDRKQLIALTLVHRRFDLARQPLDDALKAKPVDSDILRLAAEYMSGIGQPARALVFARSALEMDANNVQLELFVARLLLNSGEVNAIQDGKGLCWKIAEGTNNIAALDALNVLSELPSMASSELLQVYKKLEARPGHRIRDDFAAADIQWRIFPERRSLFLAQMIAQYQKGSKEGILALGRWLNAKGIPEKTINVLLLEDALKDRDLLLVYLDALSTLKRWAEVDKILTNEKTSLEPVLLAIFKARAASELGQNKAAELYWRSAEDLAVQQPQWLSYLADYAAKNGEFNQAEKAYRLLSKISRTSRDGYNGLIQLAERRGRTQELRDILKEMGEQFPDELAIQNDIIYLGLLLNESVPNSVEKARQALDKNQDSYAARTTLALGFLRLSKIAEAKALYTASPINWSTALPGWQAVYVAVLGTSGQQNTAKALAKLIDTSKLKPEEKELIRRFLI
jgi:Tfp pilus assembly protein PilF